MDDVLKIGAGSDARTDGLSGRAGTVVDDIRGRVFARRRDSTELEDDLVAILVPRFDGAILGRFLMSRLKKPFFRIRLDAAGSFVWKHIDGLSTVDDIARAWARQNPGEEMPLARVALFVRALAVQGHIMEVDGPDSNLP